MKKRERNQHNFTPIEESISGRKLKVLELVIVCACLCLLLSHLFTSFSYSNWFWGVNYLYFFPPFVRWLVTMIGIIACIPSVARIFFKTLKKIPSLNPSKGLKRIDRRIWYGLISLTSFGPFWLLRSKTHFLGDGYLLISSLNIGSPLSSRRHLYSYINKFLHTISGWDAAITCALISCFCGTLFVFGVLLLGDFFTKDNLKRILVWGLLLSMGGMELFFGYVEVYSLLVVGIVYYLLFSLYYLNRKCCLVIPAMALTVTFFAHDSAICLFPSLLYLFLLMGKNTFRKDDTQGISKRALLITSVSISIYVFFYGLLTLLYRHSQATLAGKIYKGLGPMSLPWNKLWLFFTGLMPLKGNPLTGNHGMFSFVHLSNIINEHILIAPIGLALCGLMLMIVDWRKILRNQVALFLGIASVLYFLLSLTYNPLNGASRDWDVFTPAGLLYTLLAIYLLTKNLHNRRSLRYLTVILVLTSILLSIPWIVVNADEIKGLNRFQLMISSKPHWSKHAIGYAYDGLAHYFYGKGQINQAANKWKKALDFSYNPRYALCLSGAYYNLGTSYLKNGSIDLAIQEIKRAIDINPNIAEMHNNLGIAYEEKGLYEKAIGEYQAALKINPMFTNAHHNLGDLFYRLYKKATNGTPSYNLTKNQLREKAIYSYKQFIRYWTGDPKYTRTAEENIRKLRATK